MDSIGYGAIAFHTRIKGDVGQMALRAHGIDLSKELVHVDDALLSDARLSVELSDTVPPDTTPKTNKWKVNIQKLKLKNTALALHMPGDTLRVNAYMGDATAHGTYLDLFKGLYQVRALDWRKGRVTYDNYQTEILIRASCIQLVVLTFIRLKSNSSTITCCLNKGIN